MMKDDDVKLLRGFADRQTDRQTNEQTFVIVESLSGLKKPFKSWHHPLFMTEHSRVMKDNGSQHKKNQICRQK